MDIDTIMLICKDEEDLTYIFEEKSEMIKNKILEQQALLEKLNKYKQLDKIKDNTLTYKVEISYMPPVKVASLRYKGRYSDVGKYIKTIYKEIKGNAKGIPFCIYYDGEYSEIANIEVCIPIKKMINSNIVNIKEIPEIEGIKTIHYGSYSEIKNAYKAVFDYQSKNKLNCPSHSREIYLKGPGMIFRGNLDKYITEIIIPIIKEIENEI